MPVTTLRPSPVLLPPGSPAGRELPPSPPGGLVDGDLDAYDRTTVFFDVFVAARSRLLMAIGPPLLNLEGDRSSLSVAVRDGGRTKEVRRLAVRRKPSHWTHIFGFRSTPDVPIEVSVRLGDLIDTTVLARREPQLAPARRGPITMVTMQKDNPAPWVRQWVEYHHRLGIDDFVIYDNGSADPVALERELGAIPPDVNVLIVDWPFPYGPVKWKAASFTRRGSIEHWERALGANRWYLGTDIDEYVVLGDGVGSIRELVERCPRLAGMVLLDHYSVPVYEAATPPGALPMASDYPYRDRSASPHAPKFLARPRLCRGLGVHRARARPFRTVGARPDDIYFLHYAGLNTDWKGEGRLRPRTPAEVDVVGDERVRVVFEQHDIGRAITSEQ